MNLDRPETVSPSYAKEETDNLPPLNLMEICESLNPMLYKHLKTDKLQLKNYNGFLLVEGECDGSLSIDTYRSLIEKKSRKMNLDNYYQYVSADEKAKLLIERILEICKQEQLTFVETNELFSRLKRIAELVQGNFLEKMPLEIL